MQMVELDTRDRPSSMSYVKQELQRFATQSTFRSAYIAPPKSQPLAPSTPPPVKPAKAPAAYLKAVPAPITRLATYRGHFKEVYTVGWSPDGKYIASGSGDETVQIWDFARGANVLTYCGHRHKVGKGLVQAIMWSPDGKYIASGGQDKIVKIWDATNGSRIFTYRGHPDILAVERNRTRSGTPAGIRFSSLLRNAPVASRASRSQSRDQLDP